MLKEYKVGKYGLENETEGMYARTNNGIIGTILNSNSDEMINGPEILVNGRIYCIERDSIKDIKEDIIDLIEVGDIVKLDDEFIEYRLIDVFDESIIEGLKQDIKTGIKINSILTKEQYESNCYTVEREKDES